MDMPQRNPTISPQELARVYDRFISARWRGEDETADTFATWIEAHWTGQAPLEPDDPPEGASVLGNAGAGIRWYARGGFVFGYASPRSQGCYRIAATETVPPLIAPWDREAARSRGHDRIVHYGTASAVIAEPAGAGTTPDRVTDREALVQPHLETTLAKGLVSAHVLNQTSTGEESSGGAGT